MTFAAIKAVFGLRVTPEEEEAGLDIVEHGMYGYPEQYVDSYDLEPRRAAVALALELGDGPAGEAGERLRRDLRVAGRAGGVLDVEQVAALQDEETVLAEEVRVDSTDRGS